MKHHVLLLMAAAPITCVYGQNEIEGYVMGWIGGQGRGTWVVLSRDRIVTVDKDERTLFLTKRREDSWLGRRVKITTRPCEEADPCDQRPAHWKGIAAAVRPADEQRPEFLRAFEVVDEFLRFLWKPSPAAPEHLFTRRCRADPRTAELIQRLRARAEGGLVPPLQAYGLNSWAFTELRDDGAQAIADPILFRPKTGLRIGLTFDGTEVLIDGLVEEPPTAHERWLAAVLG